MHMRPHCTSPSREETINRNGISCCHCYSPVPHTMVPVPFLTAGSHLREVRMEVWEDEGIVVSFSSLVKTASPCCRDSWKRRMFCTCSSWRAAWLLMVPFLLWGNREWSQFLAKERTLNVTTESFIFLKWHCRPVPPLQPVLACLALACITQVS